MLYVYFVKNFTLKHAKKLLQVNKPKCKHFFLFHNVGNLHPQNKSTFSSTFTYVEKKNG